MFEAVSVPPGQLANCLADLIADFKESYDKASPTIKSDVRTVWPEAYNLLESEGSLYSCPTDTGFPPVETKLKTLQVPSRRTSQPLPASSPTVVCRWTYIWWVRCIAWISSEASSLS